MLVMVQRFPIRKEILGVFGKGNLRNVFVVGTER
jgi:hypothetical protein